MADLDAVDLRAALVHPALAAVRGSLHGLLADGSLEVEALNRRLGAAAGVRFEVQPPRRRRREPFAADRSYDGSIVARGVVPTRPGSLHDLMNALAWAAFPASKRAIHTRQHAALRTEVADGATSLPGRRSRLRDRLSMLDEGGVLVWGEDAVEPALAAADTAALSRLVATGALCSAVLGHALTEQVVRDPSHEIRASVVWLPGHGSPDAALAQAITERDDPTLEAWLGRYPSIALSALL